MRIIIKDNEEQLITKRDKHRSDKVLTSYMSIQKLFMDKIIDKSTCNSCFYSSIMYLSMLFTNMSTAIGYIKLDHTY